MADALILTKRDDGVAIVSTNDDPLNRMTLEYVDMFSEAVEDIAADDSIRSFVVTAEGTTNFSVGMNLKQLPEGLERAGSIDAFFDQRLALISRIETMGTSRSLRSPTPRTTTAVDRDHTGVARTLCKSRKVPSLSEAGTARISRIFRGLASPTPRRTLRRNT